MDILFQFFHEIDTNKILVQEMPSTKILLLSNTQKTNKTFKNKKTQN